MELKKVQPYGGLNKCCAPTWLNLVEGYRVAKRSSGTYVGAATGDMIWHSMEQCL